MQPDTLFATAPQDASWTQLTRLPFEDWKGLYGQIARRMGKEAPEFKAKFETWFQTMPVAAVHQCGNQVRIQYRCSNRHRMQEVEKIRPVVERLLSETGFSGCPVAVELIGDFDPPETRGPAGAAVETAPDEPESAAAAFTRAAGGKSGELERCRAMVQAEIADEDLLGAALAVKRAGLSIALPPAPARTPVEAAAEKMGPAIGGLEQILVAPSFATTYDSIVHSHAAVYLPAYFVRHLRHMGAADGLRYLALRQIAYRQGVKDRDGTHLLPATLKELARWSTLAERNFPGNLADPSAYLHLLAGRASFFEYYQKIPAALRWEDAGGYHWKAKNREYCIWKDQDAPSDSCSQRIQDPQTGEAQWRKAPAIYRVQMSMPLCPEDAEALRAALIDLDAAADPLGAIQACLARSRDELIPDRPRALASRPERLYTVEELVNEVWHGTGGLLAAQVATQSKLLETHLIQPDRQLLKIPCYLIERWGARLSPAQIWTIILLMDRVFADGRNGEYRDTTVLRNGIKEIVLWTDEAYSKGASRKVTKWLYPFGQADAENREGAAGTHFNPWFSVFACEVLPEQGARVRNADNSVQMKLKVLPLIPLAPEDTLAFSRAMGCERLILEDAGGRAFAIEITAGEFCVYLPDGRTLRYSHAGELLYGENHPVTLLAANRNLDGIAVRSSALFCDVENWSRALSCVLENRPGALSCGMESRPGALSCGLDPAAGALFCELALEPGALFCALLKLLILNLYGLKNSSFPEKPPSSPNLAEETDALEYFGKRAGQFLQWTAVEPQEDWDFDRVAKGLRIADIRGLKQAGVTAVGLVAFALELFATPAEKFNDSRTAVLVAGLRRDPGRAAGAYLRLAEIGPEELQSLLRRAIAGVGQATGDPDWDSAMSRARRDDLIDLAESLALGRLLRPSPQDRETGSA